MAHIVFNDSNSNYVTLAEIAEDLKVDRHVLRRWAIDHGFHLSKMRRQGKGPLVLALTSDDARALIERRREMGFAV
jgi:hypothetical protein